MMTTVHVEEGEVRGVQEEITLPGGELFYAFRGIPYAKPPVGELRFKPPVPVEKWDGFLVPTKANVVCMQINESEFKAKEPIGTEDCLYLNVFTPQAPSAMTKKKAVMVYIHGGGFYQGCGVTVGANFLVEHDVILVTLNYRLHVFGFLNIGTPSCPGNVGLKDQVLALKWVKRNIHNFGGDPNNITLFGESAGAVSIHMHMLSPLSKGLFHKVILQSGNALSPWAVEKNPVFYARRLGRHVGWEGEDDDLEDLVEHLKHVSAEDLCFVAEELHKDDKKDRPGFCANVTFIPSVERIKEGAFLPECPEKLIETANAIPAVIGFNDREGLLFYMAQEPHHLNLVMDDLSLMVKQNFNLNGFEQEEMLNAIQRYYFSNQIFERADNHEKRCRIIDMYGDIYFMKFYDAFEHLIRSDIPPYVYLFAYDGDRNYFKQELVEPHVKERITGAAHADELGYLFDDGGTVNQATIDMVTSLCTLWTDFAKSACPTATAEVDWKQHIPERPCYMRIDTELEVFDQKLYEKRLHFWQKWSAKFIR